MSDDILSVVYLLLVLTLILPEFIYANKNKNIFFKNLLIWSVIIGLIVIVFKLIKYWLQRRVFKVCIMKCISLPCRETIGRIVN